MQAGGLVLEEGQAYANLFNVVPATPIAAAAGKKRVAPGDLDKSFLWQKLTAMLAAGEGSPMPLGSNGLAASNPELTEVIRKWILAGAPEEGLVPGTGDVGGGGGGPQPTITPLPVPAPGTGYQVQLPAYPLGTRPELEGCVFARLPNETEIYVSGYEIAMRPGSHHFILYRYDGDACDRDSDGDGTPNCLDQDSGEAFPPQFVEDIGCNDKGPADRFRKSLIAGAQTPYSKTSYPTGIALKLEPHQGVLLNSHYINYYSDTQAEVFVNLYTIPPESVQYEAKTLFDVIANSFIDVAPFTTGEASWSWSPGKRVALVGLTSHMHKRGALFTIDHVGEGGVDKNPVDGPIDSHGERHLYVNTDYVDPANLSFDPPLILEPGEKLVYTCHHDNGVTRQVKMGCEEQAGVVPGLPLSPARACHADSDCSGFGTGKCVPANLVFGPTSDDDMCIMPGVYYELEANSGGGLSSFSVEQITQTTDNPATPTPEESFTPSLSGDGTHLAFASTANPLGSNADGSLEVFTADLSTDPPLLRQLTSSSTVSQLSVFPVISNDGSTVAFTSNANLSQSGSNADGNVEVFVANFDGTNVRQLTQSTAGINGPFLDSGGNLLNLLGLSINGNGSLVAFTSTAPLGGRSSATQEVFTVKSDGSELRQLTTGTAGNSSSPNSAINGVSMSEDGTRLAFSSTGDYLGQNSFLAPQIFTVASDGTGLSQLTSFSQISCGDAGGTLCIGSFVTPSLSDDGNRIGFLRLRINLDDLSAPELQNTEPFLINADGSGLRQLFDAPSVNVSCVPPAVSQTGERATFICTDARTQQGQLYVTDAQGNGLQPVTTAFPSSAIISPPSLSDSGVTIAFVANGNLTGQNSDGNAEVMLATQSSGGQGANLENPRSGSTQSGIGAISGWACNAQRIDIVVDDTIQVQAGSGTLRGDTLSVCGDTDNGFSLLINWNLLGNGPHTVRALVDGVEFARAAVNVATLGDDFLPGLSREYTVSNFPQQGTNTQIHWEESLQNFVIGSSGGPSGGVIQNGPQALENPRPNSTQSGIGAITGWACNAQRVDVIVDDTIQVQAGYGTARGDTQDACGDTNNGFSLLVNWNLLGNGIHTLRVLVDGIEFARTSFSITTLGSDFIRGLSGEYTVPNFPETGTNTQIRWEESLQNFTIVGTSQ
jgi:Tol biopolymer transport system component